MTNYDKTLDRMKYLMEYDNSLNENKKTSTGIEYHVTAADGKEYGIIKEGQRFYIKTADPEKKNLAESYNYINGFNYRNENGYNSYNEATKQLELRLMAINEACGKHEDVSIANLNKTKEALDILTEDARKDLDRMHAIFENSFISKENIGDHGNPEGKGSSTGANTKKNNEPFELSADAKMDFAGKDGNVENAMEHDKPADPDKKLQNADKMEKGKRGDEDYKDTHDDLEGEGVADQKKSGGKVVKVNESLEDGHDTFDKAPMGFNNPDDYKYDDLEAQADSYEDLDADIFGDDSNLDDEENDIELDFKNDNEDEEDIVGLDEEMDNILKEFLDGPSVNIGDINATGQNVDGNADNNVSLPLAEDTEDADNHEPDGTGKKESKTTGHDAVMDSEMGAGSLPAQSWDKLQESIDRITESVCKKLINKKSNSLQEAIDRIVAEEVTRLNVWGKHPRFRKAPMTLPDNKEVLAGTAEGDWNDDSAKGEHPYGLKVGDGKPFDKVVDILTDQVLANLKESMSLGKSKRVARS